MPKIAQSGRARFFLYLVQILTANLLKLPGKHVVVGSNPTLRRFLNLGIKKMDNTLEKVKSILGKNLGFSITKIKENSKLVEDLGADSLDKVEIIMDIENEFNLTIPDKDAEKFETVKDILDFLSKNN